MDKIKESFFERLDQCLENKSVAEELGKAVGGLMNCGESLDVPGEQRRRQQQHVGITSASGGVMQSTDSGVSSMMVPTSLMSSSQPKIGDSNGSSSNEASAIIMGKWPNRKITATATGQVGGPVPPHGVRLMTTYKSGNGQQQQQQQQQYLSKDAFKQVTPKCTENLNKNTLRVIRSHIKYLYEFEPFARGNVTLRTVYEFMFYGIVERGFKLSYLTRIVKSIINYLKGGNYTRVFPELTQESIAYIESTIVNGLQLKLRKLYSSLNAAANVHGSEVVKENVCRAREKLNLVFDDNFDKNLWNKSVESLNCLSSKYIERRRLPTPGAEIISIGSHDEYGSVDYQCGRSHAGESLNSNCGVSCGSYADDELTFNFAALHILALSTGARVKSTILNLTTDDVSNLIRGKILDKMSKGSFVKIFIPEQIISKYKFLGQIFRLRDLICGNDRVVDGNKFFTVTSRRLELHLDKFHKLHSGGEKRQRGVRWHAYRRKYIGIINKECGLVAASKSVGHQDISTTMLYVNRSLHADDVVAKTSNVIFKRFEVD